MSILQTSAVRPNTSAILQSLVNEKPAEVEWPGYVHARDQIVERQDATEYVLNKKRIEALRYLMNHTQGYGDKYNKTEPRVFTPDFVIELGKKNSAQRLQRNPWLRSLIAGDFATSSTGGNILPFAPSSDA
jgi:hypothetical protein